MGKSGKLTSSTQIKASQKLKMTVNAAATLLSAFVPRRPHAATTASHDTEGFLRNSGLKILLLKKFSGQSCQSADPQQLPLTGNGAVVGSTRQKLYAVQKVFQSNE